MGFFATSKIRRLLTGRAYNAKLLIRDDSSLEAQWDFILTVLQNWVCYAVVVVCTDNYNSIFSSIPEYDRFVKCSETTKAAYWARYRKIANYRQEKHSLYTFDVLVREIGYVLQYTYLCKECFITLGLRPLATTYTPSSKSVFITRLHSTFFLKSQRKFYIKSLSWEMKLFLSLDVLW